MTKIVLFKTPDGREIDAGGEITRRAHERMAANSALSFARARDIVMEADPALGKAWLGVDEE